MRPGRLHGQHAPPLALGACFVALEPASAGAGLDDHLYRRALSDVVTAQGPPLAEPIDEELEGVLLGQRDGH